MFCKTSCHNLQPYKIDLHVHTTASDGYYTPREVVKLAHTLGITHLAVTDHDTTAGVKEALAAGNEYGVEIIPGLELSTLYEEQEIHILGYHQSPASPVLQEPLGSLASLRVRRAEKIVKKLCEAGYPLTMDEVKKKSKTGTLGRPHIALVLMDHGWVNSIEEGFAKFLNPGCPGFVSRVRISPLEAVSLIRKAGGVPVLAHPGGSFPADLWPFLLEAGLQGVEVYHPIHTAELQRKYLQIAEANQLVITGGSDFHGHDGQDLSYFGNMPIPPETIPKLKELAPGYILR